VKLKYASLFLWHKKVKKRLSFGPEKVWEKSRKSQKYRKKSQVKVKKRSKIGQKKVIFRSFLGEKKVQ